MFDVEAGRPIVARYVISFWCTFSEIVAIWCKFSTSVYSLTSHP